MKMHLSSAEFWFKIRPMIMSYVSDDVLSTLLAEQEETELLVAEQLEQSKAADSPEETAAIRRKKNQKTKHLTAQVYLIRRLNKCF